MGEITIHNLILCRNCHGYGKVQTTFKRPDFKLGDRFMMDSKIEQCKYCNGTGREEMIWFGGTHEPYADSTTIKPFEDK